MLASMRLLGVGLEGEREEAKVRRRWIMWIIGELAPKILEGLS